MSNLTTAREQLANRLAEFMDVYRSVLVRTIRTSLPAMIELATRLENARTWAEVQAIEAEIETWMASIHNMTPKH
jgi:hypothetical protein